MYYRMTVAGLERDLPICRVTDSLYIAGFVIFGDQELTVACARELLKKARLTGLFPNIGEQMAHPYQELEHRTGSLYGLFAAGTAEPPNSEKRRRVYFWKE